jgi:hypothetical protein
MDFALFVANTFWLSTFLSPALACVGVLARSWIILIISSLVSIPFTFYMIGSPVLHVFVLLPAVHLVAAVAVTTSSRWIDKFLLAVIISAFVWFWLWRTCVIHIGGFIDPCPPIFM